MASTVMQAEVPSLTFRPYSKGVSVFLDGRCVGHIVAERGQRGWFYRAHGGKAGAVFPSIDAVKRSLAA